MPPQHRGKTGPKNVYCLSVPACCQSPMRKSHPDCLSCPHLPARWCNRRWVEPDADLPPDPVVADSLDDLLNGRELAGTICPFPFSGIGQSPLRLPDLFQHRFLDGPRGQRLYRARGPAFALGVQADVIGILAAALARIRIDHPGLTGFAI